MDVTDLREYLARRGIPGVILEFDEPVKTVGAAEAASGVPAEQIVKSLVLMDGAGRAYICLVAGSKRLSLAKVERSLGVGSLRLANGEEVLRETGYDVGAVPPVAHRKMLTILMDVDVQRLETMVAGGGSHRALVRLSPGDVLRETGARVADISS